MRIHKHFFLILLSHLRYKLLQNYYNREYLTTPLKTRVTKLSFNIVLVLNLISTSDEKQEDYVTWEQLPENGVIVLTLA